LTRRTALAAALGALGLLVIVVVVVAVAQSDQSGEPLAAPDVRGLRLDVADSRLESLGLDVKTSGGGAFGVVNRSNWWVCTQDPGPGRETTEVEVFVERECSWRAPGVAGLTLERARRVLDRANVPYDEIDVEGKQPLAGRRWLVCRQQPTSGVATSRVRLTVARVCELPDVRGMTRAEAEQALEKLGVAVTVATANGQAATGGSWRVCDQSPTPASPTNDVRLTVGRHCRAAAPDVEFLSIRVARKKLAAAGLAMQIVTPSGAPSPVSWTVCDQDPEAGAETRSVMLFVADQPSRCAKAWPGR
jgi:beta-lactam-binding protein with PASTA domain